MSNKPKIYANCKAGCSWETVHKDDFQRSAAFIRQNVIDNGTSKEFILKEGQTVILKGDIIHETGFYWKPKVVITDEYGVIYYEDYVARSLWDTYFKVTSCGTYFTDTDKLTFYYEVGRSGSKRSCEVNSRGILIRLIDVDEVYLVNDAMDEILSAEEESV